MQAIISLSKQRGFMYPGSEIYGGISGMWDYGPLGLRLKQNVEKLWWRMFVENREDMYGLDSSVITHPDVWKASGHVASFADPLIDCKKCQSRFRADQIDVSLGCPDCSSHDFSEVRPFHMMFKTFVGAVEDSAAETYLRPETAQGIFLNFKNVIDSFHPALPFGIAQIGKAFRNEITPGNMLFRLREFSQMEIEYFVRPHDWEKYFEAWRTNINAWGEALGLRLQEIEVPAPERAFYSKRTIDFNFSYPFGQDELYGLAYRGDYDLQNHTKFSGKDLYYFDEATKERIVPHVIEPTFGVDRTILALLLSAYATEPDKEGTRTVLKLKPNLAPYTAAVFPLLSNKPELVLRAREIYQGLKSSLAVAWDDIGNIGKRYRRQDEIGTPYAITVDFETLEDGSVTVRDRDSMQQERVNETELAEYLRTKIA
ncbi:MAG: glycine--tRNA ligase [Candidatus Sungbacteria bacterium]|uniref:glycine--tRNA ligase n=1 Tax=Candidatus Sungiibacteriota bacterium TaxID=2750080 RepID=A0A9D6LRK1_9BACT|nr:glycine--tRNA ligase [Candidatus Sungbacteria bacterium]